MFSGGAGRGSGDGGGDGGGHWIPFQKQLNNLLRRSDQSIPSHTLAMTQTTTSSTTAPPAPFPAPVPAPNAGSSLNAFRVVGRGINRLDQHTSQLVWVVWLLAWVIMALLLTKAVPRVRRYLRRQCGPSGCWPG